MNTARKVNREQKNNSNDVDEKEHVGNREKIKGQHDEGQQHQPSPRGKSSFERVSERISENL